MGQGGVEGMITKGQEETSGVRDMFIILNVVKGLWVYAYVNAHHIAYFKYAVFCVPVVPH